MGTVTGLLKGIKSEFQLLTKAPERVAYAPFIQEINSVSNEENYWIPTEVGNPRALLDGIELKQMNDLKLTIVNKEYYDGLEELRLSILNSQEYLSANVQNHINSIVTGWQSFKVNAIDDLIGNNGNAFDGTAFFSSSGRPNIATSILGGSTGASNQSTGAMASATDTSDFFADVAKARTGLWSIRDINKRYYNDPNNTDAYVWVPVDMKDSAEKIFNPGQNLISIAGVMISNPYAGTAKIITYQTTTHNWMMSNGNAPVKPFIIQNRQEPEWFMTDNPENRFVKYFYKAVIGFGYGSPFSMYRVVNA